MDMESGFMDMGLMDIAVLLDRPGYGHADRDIRIWLCY
jgi:hypothetical protein